MSWSLTEDEIDAFAKVMPITSIERFLLTTPLRKSLVVVALAVASILALIWWKIRTVDKRRKSRSMP